MYLFQGLVNFVPAAAAYNFCLNFPEKFSQPGAQFLAQPCIFAMATYEPVNKADDFLVVITVIRRKSDEKRGGDMA